MGEGEPIMSRTMQQFEIDGQRIWVEVEDVPITATSKFSNTAAGGGAELAATVTSVDLSATLRALIGPVRAALESFKPDEVSVELSLGLAGKVGVFVASSEASAQIKISAKWKPTVATEPPAGSAG